MMPRLDKPSGCRSCAKDAPARKPARRARIRAAGLKPASWQPAPRFEIQAEEPAATEEELDDA